MGFSVATSSSISSMMAEIALTQADGANDAEGLTMPPELMDPEALKELFQQGTLRGESKTYTFIQNDAAALSQKLTDYLSEVNRPQPQKLSDSKGNEHSLSYKASLAGEKELKMLQPGKELGENKTSDAKNAKAFEKTHETMQRTLEKASLPKSQQLPSHKEIAAIKQQQNHAKTLEHHLHHSFIQKDTQSQPQRNSNRKSSEERKETRQEKEQEVTHPSMQRLEKNRNEERERDQQHKRKRDEEEGFTEGQKDNQQQQDERDNHEGKVSKIEKSFTEAFDNYAIQDSILSEIFKMRISQFDVLLLFLEILKLEIKGREQERIARKQERELQILHMQNVVNNYKSAGKWQMFSSLGSGVLAIVSGACPIIGHMKGDWIIQKLGSVFSSMRDMKKDQFFKGITKITFAMSEMYKSTGQIHTTFSDGSRTYHQHMSDLHRTDWEENTRTMEEIKDNWKGIENFLYQTLQMQHETIRQLYSH